MPANVTPADIAGTAAVVGALLIIILVSAMGDTQDARDPKYAAAAPSTRGCLIVHIAAVIALAVCGLIVYLT